MTFGEKLCKLRKEKGLSQELLAEQLGTSRQAISKWENHQGFPEIEKLLQLSDLFGVSTDYLLKDESTHKTEDKPGYYISREMAAGYLANQKKVSCCIGMGFMFWALAGIPWVMFPANSAWRFSGTAICFIAGIAAWVVGAISEEGQYKRLKEEILTFDRRHLKDLSDEYYAKKSIYNAVFLPSTILFILGIIAISLTMQEIFIWSKYHAFIFLAFAAGLFGFCYCAGVIDAYELLVNNEEHVNKFRFKIKRKIREKIAQW